MYESAESELLSLTSKSLLTFVEHKQKLR